MLSGPESLQLLLQWARARKDKKQIDVQCMVDTGMTRIGFQVDACVDTIAELVSGDDHGLHFAGLCTHMADAPDEEYTLTQFARFTSVLQQLGAKHINVEMLHCENSKSLMCDVIEDATVRALMDSDTQGYVRVGGALYGYAPAGAGVEMTPTVSLKAQIRHICAVAAGTPVGYGQAKSWVAPDDVLIATLSIGYADGYPRGMSNQQRVVRIGDELYDVAGRVCMDMMMVNLGNPSKNDEISKIKMGDYAVLWGPQAQHAKNVQVAWMAEQLGEYSSILEILCGINSQRVPICYT